MSILGKFVWFDLMTTAPEEAVAFYTAVTGCWDTTEWEAATDDMAPYVMWTMNEKPFGGSMPLPAEAVAGGAPPHWLAYIGTPDVDATVKKAEGLGATVFVPPTDIPTVGRFAVLADPSGAVFAAFTPEDAESEQPAPNTAGSISWHELHSGNPSEAFDFYAALFEWKKTDSFEMGPMGTYQMFGQDGSQYGGMVRKPDEMPLAAWLQYITVTDIESSLSKVKEFGGQVTGGPMTVPTGDLVAQCTDPQGGVFALHEVKPA